VKSAIHDWVRRWWKEEAGRSGTLASIVAAPFELLYRAGVAARNRRFQRGRGVERADIPVVSVGNLTVGGTGKTPFSAWVVRLLVASGARPVLLARGYGEDELLLHRKWNPAVPVLAGASRAPLAREAARRGADVVVLDDGFQHRGLARTVDVVLLAAEDPFPGALLPRGPYREPIHALGRAHVAVVVRRTASWARAAALASTVRTSWPHLRVGVAALEPGEWKDLEGRRTEGPQGPVLAAAAVARPEAFRAQASEATGQDVQLVPFADHHRYSERDARGLRVRAGSRTLVVTEKDAVKLRAFESILGPVRVLTQTLRWEEGEEAVRELILGAVGEAR
jgi:tetraacyldisaccharide 4'-kinase